VTIKFFQSVRKIFVLPFLIFILIIISGFIVGRFFASSPVFAFEDQSVDAEGVRGGENQPMDSDVASGEGHQSVNTQSASEQNPEGEQKSAEVTDAVELNGDIIEYSIDGNKITARGNVVVINKDMNLFCDTIEFSRNTNMAYATGNVRLIMKKGDASEITGEKLTFNFLTMEGSFDGANIYAKPYFGYGEKVTKIDDNLMRMEDDYITTCDYDKPHYRLASKKMDIYPGDKLIARSVRMFIGNIPLLYLPKMTQDLSKKEPMVTFTPGFDKDWGIFLLSNWRYYLNENLKGIIHVDVREKKDIAWGIDLDYKIPKYGKGLIRTYYLKERNITSKHFYNPRPSPTIEKERFRVEWRHKWKVDEKTEAILQYSKQSDSTILKDYFEREFDGDVAPDTFFFLTRQRILLFLKNAVTQIKARICSNGPFWIKPIIKCGCQLIIDFTIPSFSDINGSLLPPVNINFKICR